MDEFTTEAADPREAIAQLEERIEALEAKIENCRKFAAASRFAMTFGGVLLLGLLFGLVPFEPLTMIAAMAAGLGGVVMLGSNKSTQQEAEAELSSANAARAELIGRIDIRVVESPCTLH